MQHIDKKIVARGEADFKAVVDPYLRKGLFRYDSLSAADRILLRNTLELDQGDMCAYCMKHTPEKERTNEHIIPKDIAQNNYGRAYRHLGGGLYRNDILYDKNYTPISFPNYYPHSLAYGNIVLACDTCNSCKGDDLVRPLFFSNPVNGVSYNDKGLMVLASKDSMSTKMLSWLNENKIRQIRCFWRAVKITGLSVDDILNAHTASQRKEICEQIKQYVVESTLLRDLNQPTPRFSTLPMWKELQKYDWFWCYW